MSIFNYHDINTIYHNINIISQSANKNPEAFVIEEKKKSEGKILQSIKTNPFITEMVLRAKHFVCGGRKSYHEGIASVIETSVAALNQAPKKNFIDDAQTYTDIFLAAQRYNHSVNMAQEKALKNSVPLFKKLSLSTFINFPEAQPVQVVSKKIKQTKLADIPPKQEPHIIKKGLWRKRKFYHYNKADTKMSHSKEAINIFLGTQRERLLSLIGRIVEKVARCFGKTVTFFKKYHYFKKDEDKTGKIYAKDAPVSRSINGTSYWIGHATCLMNVPLKSNKGDPISINLITDPVEGDLNKILYPRMTKPAKTVDTCPVPHVFLLSHNHRDHLDEDTLKKLVKYQPVMLVPEADKAKFTDLGFKNVYENNWWKTTTIPIVQGDKKAELKITAVPSNHWSGRGACDGHHAAFVGYVIHKEDGDVYFAGDTARLSDKHITMLAKRFNIRTMFQPGGPDEARKDMESTHQSSADGLWMHFVLLARNLYEKGKYRDKSKNEFIEEAKKLRTIYMHTKTYKLGNLHFDDTEASIERVKKFLDSDPDVEATPNERIVGEEILSFGKKTIFQDGSYLTNEDILKVLNAGVVIPMIGSRTELAGKR